MIRLTVTYGPPRKAPPSLRRPRNLDPLQVDVLAALIATIPPKEPRP
ncbi:MULTISPECIES: hypothetical protein [unclassified Sphingomonas]|jgi:hypothetical protein|nr:MULTISPECIES: hypothetical protein [unclassified Sphingomonas]